MLAFNQLERQKVTSALRQNSCAASLLPSEIERALHSTGYRGLRAVEIHVDDEVVFLLGHVPTYHMKQVAQTAAQSVTGVREVRNELNVQCTR